MDGKIANEIIEYNGKCYCYFLEIEQEKISNCKKCCFDLFSNNCCDMMFGNCGKKGYFKEVDNGRK